VHHLRLEALGAEGIDHILDHRRSRQDDGQQEYRQFRTKAHNCPSLTISQSMQDGIKASRPRVKDQTQSKLPIACSICRVASA
jgi:hypothetical protein